jgi:hypothetical protein
MNGAVEKYAPVRAAPRWRSPNTNKTKLTPYPRKPMRAAPATLAAGGRIAPASNAKLMFTVPATNPLTNAIWAGSAALSLRVRLLSIPQARQAPAIATAPRPTPSGPFCQDSASAPSRIAAAPMRRRRSTFSRNAIHAISMVARPSRLSNSEADDAGVVLKPIIRSAGPIAPPVNTTNPSHGRSPRRSGASSDVTPSARRTSKTADSPTPEPR